MKSKKKCCYQAAYPSRKESDHQEKIGWNIEMESEIRQNAHQKDNQETDCQAIPCKYPFHTIPLSYPFVIG